MKIKNKDFPAPAAMEPRSKRGVRIDRPRALAAASACAIALGQAAPASPPPSDQELSEVQVTATRRLLAPLDVSAFVSSIEQSALVAHIPLTVVDHFRGEPGIFVQETTPGQGVTIIRGLKGSEVLHLVDGFRLNNAIFRNAPNQYVALVDAWNLERVEAVRGPMSSLHGGDAMGGVVHFITRAPQFMTDAVQHRARAGVQAETANSSAAGYLEGEVGSARWSAHGGAAWQDVDTLRVGGGQRLPHTSFRSHAAHARVEWRTEAERTLIAQAQYSEQPETPRHDALVPGYGQVNPDSSEAWFQPQERRFAQLRWLSREPHAFADSLDAQAGFQEIVDDRATRAFAARERDLEENSSELLGASVQLAKQVGGEHYFTYGAEAYRDLVQSTRTSVDVLTGTATVRQPRFPDGSTMSWIGAYAADEWQATQRLGATLGARFTRYRIRVEASGANPGVSLEPTASSWNLGLLYRTTEHFRLVMNAGHGFRPPNIFDLGAFGPRQNRFNIPNPELRPERVLTVDLGFKYEDEAWQAEVAVFRARHGDKITSVLTGDVDSQGRAIVRSQNATRVVIDGVEGAVRRTLAGGLGAHATVTWTRGEEELAGSQYPADRIPPLFGRLALRYERSPAWRSELAVRWAATQHRLSPRDQVDPRIDPQGTEGWAVFDLGTTFTWTDRARIALGVENLTDRRYREHGSGFDAPGRNATARIDWNL